MLAALALLAARAGEGAHARNPSLCTQSDTPPWQGILSRHAVHSGNARQMAPWPHPGDAGLSFPFLQEQQTEASPARYGNARGDRKKSPALNSPLKHGRYSAILHLAVALAAQAALPFSPATPSFQRGLAASVGLLRTPSWSRNGCQWRTGCLASEQGTIAVGQD